MATRQVPATALIAAQERLVAGGMTRRAAAARLLPQQSPESAARYLRKLRTGERTGSRIVATPRVRKRVEILAPQEARQLFPAHAIGDVIPHGKYGATLTFETTRGRRSANVRLPRPNMTVSEIVAWPGFPEMIARIEARWGVKNSYEAQVTGLAKVHYFGAFSRFNPRKPVLTLGTT